MNDIILFNVAIGNNVNKELDSDEFKRNRILPSLLKRNKEDSWENYKTKIDKQLEELSKIIRIFNDNSIDFLNLKGLALTKYYPLEIPRQSNDFDFIVKDINDFWLCDKILKDNGFTFFYFPLLTKNNESIVGITKYYKKIDDNTEILIEINIGHYIISEVTWIDDSDLWDKKQTIVYKGLKLNIPSDEFNLIILIAEASGRNEFFIRDLVDFYFLREYSNLNWNYIEKKLKNKYLIKVLEEFDNNNKAIITNDFKRLSRNNSKFKREVQYIIPSILHNRDASKILFNKYLMSFGKKLLTNEKFLRWGYTLENLISPRKIFEMGLITNLYPLNSNQNQFKWYKYENYDILAAPIGTFWVTNFGVLDKEKETEMKNFVEKGLSEND